MLIGPGYADLDTVELEVLISGLLLDVALGGSLAAAL